MSVQYLSHGRRYRWATVSPNNDALQTVTEMVEDGKVSLYALVKCDMGFV